MDPIAASLLVALIQVSPEVAQMIDVALAPATVTTAQIAAIQAARNAAIEADAASAGPAKA